MEIETVTEDAKKAIVGLLNKAVQVEYNMILIFPWMIDILNISDHIITYYQGDAYVGQVMTDFAGYIRQETLSEQLVAEVPGEEVFTESHKLGGHEISLGVKKLT